MHEAAANPAWIRLALIVLFLIITQILRARKRSQAPKPTGGKGSPLEALREAMREAAEQARAQQSGQSTNRESSEVSEQFRQPPKIENIQQPPTIEPESSFIPSLLLLALLGCLVLMAYRHWAG